MIGFSIYGRMGAHSDPVTLEEGTPKSSVWSFTLDGLILPYSTDERLLARVVQPVQIDLFCLLMCPGARGLCDPFASLQIRLRASDSVIDLVRLRL